MISFDYFDSVYVIHLPNPERRAAMEGQLAGVGIRTAQFVYAAPPMPGFTMSNMRRAPAGEFGANMSHIKAVVHAIADGAERPLFVEDDIVFADNAVERMARVAEELPENWDVLYMGGHPRGIAPQIKAYSDNLKRVGTFSFAESYAINRPALLRFYDYWSDRIGRVGAMYDFILGEFASRNNGFCVHPLLTSQPPGMSQISGKLEDKRDLIERGWANHLGALRKQTSSA